MQKVKLQNVVVQACDHLFLNGLALCPGVDYVIDRNATFLQQTKVRSDLNDNPAITYLSFQFVLKTGDILHVDRNGKDRQHIVYQYEKEKFEQLVETDELGFFTTKEI
jgi:hypothetical protein